MDIKSLYINKTVFVNGPLKMYIYRQTYCESADPNDRNCFPMLASAFDIFTHKLSWSIVWVYTDWVHFETESNSEHFIHRKNTAECKASAGVMGCFKKNIFPKLTEEIFSTNFQCSWVGHHLGENFWKFNKLKVFYIPLSVISSTPTHTRKIPIILQQILWVKHIE